MGTYHTFFVASVEQLERLFPGWKSVKPEKVTVQRRVVFSNEPVAVAEWGPVEPPTQLGKPSLYDDVWGPPVAPVIAPENEYVAELETAGAPGLRALPHFRAKNFEPFLEFEALAAAVLRAEVEVPPARMGCADDDDIPMVFALPDAVARELAAVDDARLAEIAAEVLVGHDDEGDEGVAFYVGQALVPLRALATKAQRVGGLVCHYLALHP